MTLRRELAVSFALQGAGAAAVLLATLWLGAVCGPQVQGSFNRAKSELEFVGALATFGLPQALFFHLRSGRIDVATALRWVGGCSLLALPLGAAAGGLFDRATSLPLVAALALAVASFVAQGQLRALLLVRERATRFNLATAAPQLLTLAGVGGLLAFAGPAGLLRMTASAAGGSGGGWFAVFVVAYGATALFAWRSLPADSSGGAAPRAGVGLGRSLLRYGLAAWLTAAFATAAILGVQRWVEDAAGRAALGRFTMAMTLTQVPLTPISYAAPLLFRRWIQAPGHHAAGCWSARLFAGLLALAGLVGAASGWRDDLGLGPAYAGATLALALLLVGGAAEAASRVLAVQANATGLPWVAVRAEAARGAVLVAAWLALPASLDALAICAVWSAAALAAAAVLVGHRRH